MGETWHTVAVCREHARLVDGGGRRLNAWWRLEPGAFVMECAKCGWWWRRQDLPLDDIEPYDVGQQLSLFGDSHAA